MAASGSRSMGMERYKNVMENMNKALDEMGPPSSKISRLWPGVLETLMVGLEHSDLLNIRLVSRSWKSAVDNLLISQWAMKGMTSNALPRVVLNGVSEVAAFRRSMAQYRNSTLGPIPFEICLGVGLGCFPIRDEAFWLLLMSIESVLRMYWDAVYELCQSVGTCISSISLLIRANDGVKTAVVERICRMVMNCLKQLPNLECLSLCFGNVRIENMFAEYYDKLLTKGEWKGRLKTLPSLSKLKSFEVGMVGDEEVQPRPTKPFLELFMEKHGQTVKRFRIVFGLSQLKAVKNMVKGGAENVEELAFELIDCNKKRGVEPILDGLPKVAIKPEMLKKVNVVLTWHWRACDVLGLLRWLGSNYPDESLKELELGTCMNQRLEDPDGMEDCQYDFWSTDEEEDEDQSEDDSDDDGYNEPDDLYNMLRDEVDEIFELRSKWLKYHKKKRFLTQEGNKETFSEKTMNNMKLPKVEILNIKSEYAGSWRWLTLFPREHVKELLLCYALEDPEETYRTGFLEGLKGGNEVIWKLFPKLQELAVGVVNEVDVMLWHMIRQYFEDYKKGWRNKEGAVKREAVLIGLEVGGKVLTVNTAK